MELLLSLPLLGRFLLVLGALLFIVGLDRYWSRHDLIEVLFYLFTPRVILTLVLLLLLYLGVELVMIVLTRLRLF